MMMSNLPGDLVYEILSRVPLKSMRAVRLTCMKWNALSKTRGFTKMFLDREVSSAREGEYQMIVMKDFNLFLMSIMVNENPSTESLGKLTCLNDSEQIKVSQVYHCKGLLLCILKEDDTKVVVWNPYLAQTRWIQTKYFEGQGGYKYAIGYENKKNKSFRSHKILRFIDDDYQFLRYEIYDFDSDLWATLDANPHWYIERYNHGLSLKGNTYWCARGRNSAYGLVDRIISFDFTRERFGPLMPLPFRGENYDIVTLSCVREEKLAALHMIKFFQVNIWITTKIDATKVSWSKFMTVVNCQRLLTWYDGSFFIDEDMKVAAVLNKCESRTVTFKIFGEAGYFGELNLGEATTKAGLPGMCSYVPSSLQIKEHAVGKRKKKAI